MKKQILLSVVMFMHCAKQQQVQDYVNGKQGGTTTTATVSSGQMNYVPDTGQTQCASGASANAAMGACPNASVGAVQDGDFVNVPNARSYTGPTQHATYTSDYTTKDNLTGLTWKSCPEGLSGATCATGSATTFTWATANNGTTCGTALNSMNSGAGYAGITSWRLPTILELATLINYSGVSPAIDSTNFPATVASFNWSATASAGGGIDGLYVQFFSGYVGNTAKTLSYSVRCVSGPARTLGAYLDNGDGTVTDRGNNLRWQKCNRGQNNDSTCSGTASNTTWLTALSYCQNLSLAGRSWRLPNIQELRSLADYSSTSPINTTFFPSSSTFLHWSSTTNANTPTDAFQVDFSTGYVGSPTTKSANLDVRCVSTGP